MTCPKCNSDNEMVFSVLSHGCVCQEASCGFELELEWQDLVQLFQLPAEGKTPRLESIGMAA